MILIITILSKLYILIRCILTSRGKKISTIYWQHFMCVCVYFQPPARVVCPNHEVVLFQTRTGTSLYLCSVSNYTFYSSPPAPPVSTVFLGLLNSPLYPNAPPLVAFVVVSSFSCNRSARTLPEQNSVHLDIVSTHQPPASAT